MDEKELLLRRLRRERAAREEAESIIEQKSRDLYDAKLAADQANRAKTEFLSNISHELKTPLHHVIGFARLLLQHSDSVQPEQRKEHLGDIVSSSEALLGLVEQLILLSSLETGSESLDVSHHSLQELIEQCVTTCTTRFACEEISIDLESAAVPCDIECDAAAVKQIIVNILDNAIKFTPKGGRVRIYTRPTADESVSVGIEDSGIGISNDVLPLIHQPFYQTDGGLDRHYNGAGIGLTIAKMLIDLHGGALTIDSEQGKGTKVLITLLRRKSLTKPSKWPVAQAI